jgi:hypothetical protein
MKEYNFAKYKSLNEIPDEEMDAFLAEWDAMNKNGLYSESLDALDRIEEE